MLRPAPVRRPCEFGSISWVGPFDGVGGTPLTDPGTTGGCVARHSLSPGSSAVKVMSLHFLSALTSLQTSPRQQNGQSPPSADASSLGTGPQNDVLTYCLGDVRVGC